MMHSKIVYIRCLHLSEVLILQNNALFDRVFRKMVTQVAIVVLMVTLSLKLL